MIMAIDNADAATHYYATVTGYAFGYKGASGQVLGQDGFANYQPGQVWSVIFMEEGKYV